MALTKEQIFACEDIKTLTVPVPEWGGEVIVRTLSGTERDAWEQSMVDSKKDGKRVSIEMAKARLCILSIVDEDGKRIFTNADAIALNSKSGAAIDRVYTASAKLSGITDDEVAEIAKNSEAAPSGNSTSD